MTEAQRAYLSDLSIQKGVKLTDAVNKPVSWASAKIEELKALPDAKLDELSDDMIAAVDKLTDKAVKELHKWNFRK